MIIDSLKNVLRLLGVLALCFAAPHVFSCELMNDKTSVHSQLEIVVSDDFNQNTRVVNVGAPLAYADWPLQSVRMLLGSDLDPLIDVDLYWASSEGRAQTSIGFAPSVADDIAIVFSYYPLRKEGQPILGCSNTIVLRLSDID